MPRIAPVPPRPEDQTFGEFDVLDRRPAGRALQELVKGLGEPLVISLEAPWGEGKTSFLHMWRNLVKADGATVVYLDAFASDFLTDPFSFLYAGMLEVLESGTPEGEPEHSAARFTSAAKELFGRIAFSAGDAALRHVSLGLVGVEDVVAAVEPTAPGAIEQAVSDRLDAAATDAGVYSEFRETLEKAAEQGTRDSEYPLVVLVDELDRCRPTFAVQVLEMAKHFFSVEHVVFVLSYNRSHIEQALKGVYGRDIDAGKYLRKFIDVRFHLPSNKSTSGRPDSANDYTRYASSCFDKHQFSHSDKVAYLCTSVAGFSSCFQLSLRDIDRAVTSLAIVYAAHEDLNPHLNPLFALAACVKISRPELYEEILARGLSAGHIQELLPSDRIPDDSERTELNIVARTREVLEMLTASDKELAATRDEPERVHGSAHLFNAILPPGGVRYRHKILPFVLDHLELASRD